MSAPDPAVLARLAATYAAAQREESAAHAAALEAEDAVRITADAYLDATRKTRAAREALLNYSLNGNTADFVAEVSK